MEIYEYMKKAQENDKEALEHIINIFEPKVKYSLRMVPSEYREDLEQELKVKLIEMILHYDFTSTPTFTEYMKAKYGSDIK